MRIQLFSSLSLIPFCLILLIVSVSSQCLNHEQSILIQLKNTIEFNSSLSTKIVSWNQTTDCCSWKGVNCSTDGHVIGLDLSYEGIQGGIENSSASLAKLQSLSIIRLSNNNLSSPIPEFFANFKNLTVLDLSNCELYGQFPERILQIPTLETLDLAENRLLNGFLPIFPQNVSLQTLVLRSTNFSGQIPHSISSLTQLVYLDLSGNKFSGPIPSFQKSKNLTNLVLSDNGFSGPIPNTYFEGLVNLQYIDLNNNAFNGCIPSSLFALSSPVVIFISNNSFNGLLANFPNASSSNLVMLNLSRNRLEGPIPKSFFDLKSLRILSLSKNHLNGTVELGAFSELGSLAVLDLSNNNLSIETRGENSTLSAIPQLTSLSLASCNLQYFPNLENHSFLTWLDLSNNRIGGEIPSWIWKLGNEFGYLRNLNLSYNALESLQEPYVIPSFLQYLDLHSNRLHGEIPILPEYAIYLDYSANQFNTSLPTDIGYRLNFTNYFSVSSNRITGSIPDSICTARNLYVLELSNNHLSGTIPSCLVQLTRSLGVLNLGKNNFSGNIPGIFSSDCGLETLDLHENRLEGKVPLSLGSCSMLRVLNLGNNLINDTFPCFLMNCTNLRVLTVRSNKLHGDIQCSGTTKVWSKLQIIDLASNYFIGHVPNSYVLNWRAMIANDDGKLNYLHFGSDYYVDKVTVVMKRNVMELVKILTIFTSIDFSNNWFSGEIPGSIGELKALRLLNMSHNAFTSSIPASIGDLKQLESLDFSVNNLTGRIPTQLAKLTFLSFLNLSYNLLEGRIPAGPQLQTFTATSFQGNKGLCRSELNISCVVGQPPSPSEEVDRKDETNWDLISFEVGLVVGLATVIAPLVLSRRWSKWYFKHVDRIVADKVYRYYQRRNQERKNPIRRL